MPLPFGALSGGRAAAPALVAAVVMAAAVPALVTAIVMAARGPEVAPGAISEI